jgi:hypothetical protein
MVELLEGRKILPIVLPKNASLRINAWICLEYNEICTPHATQNKEEAIYWRTTKTKCTSGMWTLQPSISGRFRLWQVSRAITELQSFVISNYWSGSSQHRSTNIQSKSSRVILILIQLWRHYFLRNRDRCWMWMFVWCSHESTCAIIMLWCHTVTSVGEGHILSCIDLPIHWWLWV